jgi:hypothetical protein
MPKQVDGPTELTPQISMSGRQLGRWIARREFHITPLRCHLSNILEVKRHFEDARSEQMAGL